ncbi:MAG: MerR family DNA-binding protein [Polyangiales bacterium]
MIPMSKMTIGTVAKLAGVGVETVRFYERRGVIVQPARRGGAFREYPNDTVKRLQFVHAAQGLGFTLDEITSLLALRASPGKSCATVRDRALAKVAILDDKLRELRRMRRALVRLSQRCDGDRAIDRCGILDVLDRGGDA